MRFEDLNCLVAVADTGSITAAAKRVFISQQAVSANIKKLEDELQCTLLVREKDGVSLTSKGQETVVFARKMLEEKEEFCNRIRMEEQVKPVLMNICSTSSVTNIVLPNALERIEAKKQHFNLKLKMEDDVDTLFERVKNGDSHIGLLTFNAEELMELFAVYQNELQLDVLARDEMVAVFNRKFFTGESLRLNKTQFNSYRQSLYNIIPAKKQLASAQRESTVWSNDAEFHRALLERNGTMVLMPSLAYQYFFYQKKYVALALYFDVPLIHAAVYRKDALQYIQDFANMIRLEMHMK